MRGNEFLDKMELIDLAYVEAADAKPKGKKNIWVKLGAMAACLCLVIGGFAAYQAGIFKAQKKMTQIQNPLHTVSILMGTILSCIFQSLLKNVDSMNLFQMMQSV